MAEVKLFKLSYSGEQLEERLAAIGTNFAAIDNNLKAINANSAADAEFKNYVTSYYATKEELAKLFDNKTTEDIDSLVEVIEILNTKYDAGQIANLLNDYLTESDAKNLYQPKGDYQLAGEYVKPNDLNNYATISYVDTKISDLLNGVDTDHDTLKEIVDLLNAKQDAAEFISALQSKADVSALNNYAMKNEIPDVAGLISEEDADAKYQAKGEYLTEHQDISGLATKAELEDYQPKGNYLTEHQDISGLATKAELEDYATLSYVSGEFATPEYVDNRLSAVIDGAPASLNTLNEIASYFAQYPNTNVFVSAMSMKADKTDLANYQPKGDYLTEHQDISGLATKAELEDYQPKGDYLTEHQDISGLATKAELEDYQPKGDYLTEHQDISGLATKAELEDYQPKGDYITEHQSLEGYATESYVAENYQPKGEYLTEHQDISGLATKAELADYQPAGEYLTEHQDLSDYALKADLDNYVEKKLSETDSFNVIYDEASWNASYENGALHRYYTKYPDEDLWSVELQRTATFNDKCYDVEIYSDATCETLVKNATLKASWETSEIQKVTDAEAGASYYTVKDVEVDGIYELFSDNINSMSAGLFIKVKGISFPGFTQCWDGAVKAPGAKYPWVVVYFDEDVNSVLKFQYEGKSDVYPWGSKVFGVGNGHKDWGAASVAEEFQDNSFLIPENAANANPEWDGEAGAQSTFDVSKFKLVLINQEDVNSLKDYVDSEITRVEAEIPVVPTNVSDFENDANYLTEHQSLVGYATEQYVDNKISDLIGGADESLDTLKEIADVINDEDTGLAKINTILGYKANEEDVYNKTAADDKFVDKAKYDELNDKYTTLFNVVYSNATGEAATALNADYVANNLSNENTSVEITEGELGDVTIPETTKAMTVTAPMQDESTITLSSPKAFTLINTSENPVDVTIDAPAGTSIPTMSCSGEFDTLEVNNGSIGAKSGEAPLTATNVVINNDLGKNATVSGVEFNDNATITSNNVPGLGVANNNTDQNAPNVATINAENSTVTLNKGQWNTLNTTVSDNTLIVTQNANINTLNVVKGNVLVYDREITNRIGNVVNNNGYTVACRETNVTTGNELNSALTGNPGIVNVMNDITRGRITWGIFGSGNYLLDLKGHTVTLSDANFGLKTRNTVNIKIVDTVGGGKLINDKSYGPWADEDGVITLDIPETTEIIGVTHTLYAYGSRKPHINVIGGTYKMTIDSDETDIYDVNGNYKFMLNHYDSTFTREGNCFTITGGTFYGFDPSRMNGDPGAEYSMIDLNNYEVQVIGTFVDSKEHTMNIYKVVAKA